MVTSYFAKEGSNPDAVAICLSIPDWYRGRWMQKLAPPRSIFHLRQEEFVPAYLDYLDTLDPDAIAAELGEDAVLLCYEKPGTFCHRRLLADWLEEKTGRTIPELGEQPRFDL